MKKLCFGFLVALGLASAGSALSADSYKVLIANGKHAGQCVSIDSFEGDQGHVNHGEYWYYYCE